MAYDQNAADLLRERDEARAEVRRLKRTMRSLIHKPWAHEMGVKCQCGFCTTIRAALARPTPKKRKSAKTHGTYWSHVNADRDTIQEMMRSDRQPKRKSAKKVVICAPCVQGQHAHAGSPTCLEPRCQCPCRKQRAASARRKP